MRVRTNPSTRHQSVSETLLCAAIIIGALHFAREILLPFVLAVLLSFLLTPAVKRLERWKLGRVPSVMVIVTLSVMLFVVLGWVLANQMYDLAYKLPSYQENILNKAQAFQGDSNGVVARVTGAIEEISRKLAKAPKQSSRPAPSQTEASQPASAKQLTDQQQNDTPAEATEAQSEPTSASDPTVTTEEPVKVEMVERLSATQIAESVLGPLISPLTTFGMVIVFVIFMLLNREDLRNRFIRLTGAKRLKVATEAIDDAAVRVSSYLVMQLIINALYAAVICVGLFFVGLPNALLWGVLTGILRFIPYAGPWIAALMPIAISLAVFDGWSRPLWVLVLFVVNELLSNNVVEPLLYGKSTGISTMGILVSAVFWAWIWGPVGLVLATPLTVCLMVLAKHVSELGFLTTMLSDEQVLPVHSQYYQRLLALDPEEAVEVAEEYVGANSVESLFDQVLLPALGLAEADRHNRELDDEQQSLIFMTTREIIEDLGREPPRAVNGDKPQVEAVPKSSKTVSRNVLCLPARDEADEIVGLMLAKLLERRGVSTSVVSASSLTSEMVTRVESESDAVVCVSALPPHAATHARYLCKRLRPKLPDRKVIVGLWQVGEISQKARQHLEASGTERLVTSLADAVTELEQRTI